MADANIRAVITAKDEASGVINKFSGNSVAAFGVVAGAAAALANKAIDVLSQSIGDAVKRVDTLNNSTRVFENMGFKAGDVAVSMDALKKSILGLPTPLDSAVRGMQMIASTTPDINRAQGVFSALNDAVIGFGGSAEMVDGAILQLSQAFSNGRVDAQTWNSMMQNGLGPTLNAIAKNMGITTGALKEGLSNGTVSVQQFQDQLIELDKKGGGGLKSLQTIAHDATAGIGTGIENAKTAISRGLGNIIQAFGSANISNAIADAGGAIEKIFNRIALIIPPIITYLKDNIGKAWTIMKTALDFLMPSLLALWNTIETQLWPSLQKLWQALQPILPVLGVALVGAIYLIINTLNILIKIWSFWVDNVLVPFYNFMFKTLPEGIAAGIAWIVERVTYMKNHFWETVGFIIGFFATLPIKIPFLIAEMLAKVVGMIASINWGAVWSGLWNFLTGLWGRITNGFRDMINNLAHLNWGDIGKGIANGVIGMIEGAINGALKGLSGAKSIHLPRFASGVTNFAGGLAVVGERGPEVVQLPQGSNVIPNNKAGGFGGNINLSVNVGVYAGTEQEKRKVAKELFNALGDIASSKNMTVAELLA